MCLSVGKEILCKEIDKRSLSEETDAKEGFFIGVLDGSEEIDVRTDHGAQVARNFEQFQCSG